MTTKFLTIKFENFLNLIFMELHNKKNSVFAQISLNFPPPPDDPLQNAMFFFFVSASLVIV